MAVTPPGMSVLFCATRRGGAAECRLDSDGNRAFLLVKRGYATGDESLRTGGKDSTMGDTHIDPAVFKAQQREQWSNVAQGWRRRWAAFEQGAQPLSDRMMNLAHVAPGQRVLDVATGIGEPAMTAARQVGPSGSVVAIDQAPQMLAVARERMQAAGIRTVEVVERA